MSFPSADDLRRKTKPISKAEQQRAESLRQAQERAEVQARIEQGHYTTRAERRQVEARLREKARADYDQLVDEHLSGARDALKYAMHSAAAHGERSAGAQIGETGNVLERSEYPLGGLHQVRGKYFLDDTAFRAGEILTDEVRKLGYEARLVTHQEVIDPTGDTIVSGKHRTIVGIEVSW